MTEMGTLALAAGVGRGAVEPTPLAVWVFLLAAALVGLAVLVRAATVLRRPVRAQPAFCVPQDVSSAQAGFLMDGDADDRDLLSLILSFAGRGILTVSADEWDGGDPARTPLVLEKRRDLPPDAPDYERTLLDALFPGGRTLCHLTRPDDGFAAGLETAKDQLAASFSGEKALYRPRTLLHSLLAPFAGCLALFLGLSRAGVGWALAACLPLAMLGLLVHLAYRRWRFLRPGAQALWAVAGALLAGLAGLGAAMCALGASTPLWLTVPAFLLSLAACLLAPLLALPTDFHIVTCARLLGLFRYLENPPAAELATLCDDGTDVFFAALPYAYVFGLAEGWARACAGVCRRAPRWYTGGYQDFSTEAFVESFQYSVETALAKNDEG